jgi:hypothetical protein
MGADEELSGLPWGSISMKHVVKKASPAKRSLGEAPKQTKIRATILQSLYTRTEMGITKATRHNMKRGIVYTTIMKVVEAEADIKVAKSITQFLQISVF